MCLSRLFAPSHPLSACVSKAFKLYFHNKKALDTVFWGGVGVYAFFLSKTLNRTASSSVFLGILFVSVGVYLCVYIDTDYHACSSWVK